MGLSPFRANYGFNPTIITPNNSAVNAPKATTLVENLMELQKYL